MNTKILTGIDLNLDTAALAFVKDEVVDVLFAIDDGTLISREGPNRFQKGDALITAANGDRWSVSRSRFDVKYGPVFPCNAGVNGTYQARRMVVLAKQMTEPFSIARSHGGDILQGVTNDWLMQYAPGDFGVVEDARFQRVYRRAL
ncbi:MAG: PGDYG domain-containing protein [Pseudomonadota bacterium]